ncbi:unnamed protein product [Diabrotica balteata]|uniref:Uncharacterized protein n=1 Tax=Diabrotica balteata TaxID=107213 RepID=A0A9N9XGK2_DIABA|nr:unnamed protein product [Diabrotica balteata]
MRPQIIPIETMYDSNNMHMPEDVYQGDAAVDDISLLSPTAMDIPNTKDSSQRGESVTLKTPKGKRKCTESEEMGDKKKEVLDKKLEILDIVKQCESVTLQHAYPNKRPISQAKKKDLLSLLNSGIILNDYTSFYESLPCSTTALRDDNTDSE